MTGLPGPQGVPRPAGVLHGPGGPMVWLGANFWSRGGGPLMWRDIDPALLRAELSVLRDHGLAMTRSFLYWPDAMPEPHRLDDDVLRRYAAFLDLHSELGMQTLPTFLVGHMSGENWDPGWRGERDLYTDTWMVARQAWYVREVTRRFCGHPAVAGWLISNEMPIYGGTGDTSVVSSWAELMVQAVRAGGGTQPVSIGDGAWGIEVTGRDNGFSVRELAALTDFVGPHVYPMENDVVRQHLKAAFTCDLAGVGGRPVVLEEFGLTSDFTSPEHAADYYRQVLHLSLLGGAAGWIAWNNTDFDNLSRQDPYRHHPFEMHFGLTTVLGEPKPQLREMRDFARVLRDVDLPRCVRWPAQAAVVVPSYLETGAPVTQDEEERTYVFRCLEQAYVAAREADVAVGLMRERDGVTAGHRLYLVPSTKALTAPTWSRLVDLAGSGAVVYASYGSGEVALQRGPWWSRMTELFGVRQQLAYGLADPVLDEVVELTFEQPFGSIAAGDRLRFRAAGGSEARTYLPVHAAGAAVVARDQHGRIALSRHEIGSGQAILCTYPVEYFAAARARANPDDTWRLYDALAAVAQVERPVRVDRPDVLVDGLRHADGHRLVWLVSESDHEQEVTPQVEDGGTLTRLGSARPVGQVRLPAYGVAVLRLGEQTRGHVAPATRKA